MGGNDVHHLPRVIHLAGAGHCVTGKGGARFILVGVYYFTKCMEADSFATTTTTSVTQFLGKAVVIRYSIPWVIIDDSGRRSILKTTGTGVESWA